MNVKDNDWNNANLSAESRQKLSAGVLKQAAQDLRRFQCGRNSAERELYNDAYTWLVSDDDVWPFSFLNVCLCLNLAPENVRYELIGDTSAGTLRYLLRRCTRAAHRCAVSFSQIFRNERTMEPADAVLSTPTPSSAL